MSGNTRWSGMASNLRARLQSAVSTVKAHTQSTFTAANLRAHWESSSSAPAVRSYFTEFLSTFLFVFATVGSAVSARMLTPDVRPDASPLVATAVAQAFALFAAVFIAADVSGGHVNPAVTLSYALGGHISATTAILYSVAQVLGSTFACFVIHGFSADQEIPTTRIAAQMTGFGASVLEAVATFMLVYTVHAAWDPRAGGRRSIATTAMASLVIGLVTGACVLATGSLTGASMNPARSFGAALVSGDFNNQAVYWAGPMIGAAAAALVHHHLLFPSVPASPHGNVETVLPL